MIADLKPYPAMKDSGVPWLGEVPEHWEVLPALTAYRLKQVKNVGMRESTVLSLSYGRIVVKPPEKLHGLVPESFESYQIVDPGDIIVRTTDLQNDQKSLRIGQSRDRGVITSAYMCLKTTDVMTEDYGYQFLNAYDLLKVIYRYGSGLRQNLDFGHIRRMPVLVQPLPEQTAIVRFLDYVDRRIRRVIRARKRRIELLEEYKRALIHQAVTGRIDVRTGKPYPAYKDSGIEWLGEVPEHWEVRRLGHLIALLTGFPFKSEGFTQDPDDIRLLRGVNISPGKIRWNDVVMWRESDRHNYSVFELCVGDIVLGMDRPIIHRGIRVAVIGDADVPSLVLQRVARIRPRKDLCGEFLVLLLSENQFIDYLSPIFTGISVPHLSPEQIRSFCLALPSADEQAEIVRFLITESEKINSAIAAARREIDLLKELRTRLIADVVTGRLDVREAAARLPEDAGETEPLDALEPGTETDEAPEAFDAAAVEAEA